MENQQINYHSEFYNEVRGDEQAIRLSDGCFRLCWNCYCPKEKVFYEIPEIVKNKVILFDMNFLYAYPNPVETLKFLGSKKVNNKVVYYDFWCGLDYTLIDLEIAKALKNGRFGRFNNKRKFVYGLRIAWDRSVKEQILIKKGIDNLVEAGFQRNKIQIFILCNGKISFEESKLKLDLLKVWNVQIADCWYDNQIRGSVKPIFWTNEECKEFGKLCRKHNQLINYRIDPELK